MTTNVKSFLNGIGEGYREVSGRVNEFVEELFNEKQPPTELPPRQGTVLLPKAIIDIYDLNGSNVYSGPLLFTRAYRDDENKKIISIGRGPKYRSDIKIEERWAGSEFCSESEAYMIFDEQTEEILFCDDGSLNSIQNEKGNIVKSMIVKDGSVVLLAGVMRVVFTIKSRSEMADWMRKHYRNSGKNTAGQTTVVDYADVDKKNLIDDKHEWGKVNKVV